MIQTICELKRRNPRFGCPKIAQHLARAFGIDIDEDRSAPLNCSLRRDRCMTITWCQSAWCSNTRSKRDHSADAKVARTWLTDEIIVGQESVAELLGTQQIPCGWNSW